MLKVNLFICSGIRNVTQIQAEIHPKGFEAQELICFVRFLPLREFFLTFSERSV